MNRRRICFALITLVAAGAATRAADAPGDSVTIKVGQELFVTFTATNGDSLVGPKPVPDANGPDPVLSIQLTQSGPSRTLTVTNGYARGLGFRCKSRKRGSRKETEQPVVNVRSGLQSTVTLGEPFDELVLYEFHLQG
jgi:hypothetical protein